MKKNLLLVLAIASMGLVGCGGNDVNLDSLNDESNPVQEQSEEISSAKEVESTTKESSPKEEVSEDDVSEEVTLYTVTFLVDGEVYYSVEAERNATIALPEDPVKEGYTFTGWSGYSSSYKVRSNKTFQASFEKSMNGLPTASTFQTPTTYNLSGDSYQVNVYEAKKISTSIEVDGILDDAYLAATPIEITARCDGSADATGFAYVVWDNSYIYCYTVVNDTNPEAYANGDRWLSDSVELVLDTWNKSANQNQNYGDSYRGGDYQGEGQFRVNAGGNVCTGMHWMFDDGNVSKSVASRIIAGEGYTAEFKIDWASFKSQAAAGKQVAFAILINNGASNSRSGVTGIEAGHIHAFEWAGVLSKLNLVD